MSTIYYHFIFNILKNIKINKYKIIKRICDWKRFHDRKWHLNFLIDRGDLAAKLYHGDFGDKGVWKGEKTEVNKRKDTDNLHLW